MLALEETTGLLGRRAGWRKVLACPGGKWSVRSCLPGRRNAPKTPRLVLVSRISAGPHKTTQKTRNERPSARLTEHHGRWVYEKKGFEFESKVAGRLLEYLRYRPAAV